MDPAPSLASVASSKQPVSYGPRAYDTVMTTGTEQVTESYGVGNRAQTPLSPRGEAGLAPKHGAVFPHRSHVKDGR